MRREDNATLVRDSFYHRVHSGTGLFFTSEEVVMVCVFSGSNIIECRYTPGVEKVTLISTSLEVNDTFEFLFQDLREREKQVIALRLEGLSLRAIGRSKGFRCTAERIRQLELKAIQRMQKKLSLEIKGAI